MKSLTGFDEAYKRYRNLQPDVREKIKMAVWTKAKQGLLTMDRNEMAGRAKQTQPFIDSLTSLFEMYDLTGLRPEETHKIYSDILIEVAAVLVLMLNEYDLLLDGSKEVN